MNPGSLDMMRFLTLLSPAHSEPGQPLSWHDFPGPTWRSSPRPLHAGAMLPGGATLIHRDPHVFLIESDGSVWVLSRPNVRKITGVRRGKPLTQTQRAGPVDMPWHSARQTLSEAAGRAASTRGFNLPTAGDPNSYALPHGRYHARWIRWTAQDESRHLASTNPTNTQQNAPTGGPMHRLEGSIAADALEVVAGRAAAAVMFWMILDGQPDTGSFEADDADKQAAAACRGLEGAVARLRAAGGDPGPILEAVAASYGRPDPTGYIRHRLACGACPELLTTRALS